jgi:hypothetical protein
MVIEKFKNLYYFKVNMKINLVLASPKTETYKGIPREKVIQEYNRMAYEEFDKQFTPLLEPKIFEETISVPSSLDLRDECCRIVSNLKRTAIDLEIGKWKDKPINASLFSLIYTSEDGYPYGEAVYLRNLNREISIERDLENFYKRFDWNVKLERLLEDPRNVEIKKLDNLLLPKLFQLSRE